MDRYVVISADGHAGPPSSVYRDYLDPEFRERVRRAPADDGRAPRGMGRDNSDVPSRVGGGDRRRRRAHRRVRLRRSHRHPRRRGRGRRGAVPRRRRARHRSHRLLAVRHRPRRRQQRPGPGRRRQSGPQPLARRLRRPGPGSPHRRRHHPGHHPGHGRRCSTWSARRRTSGTPASSSPPVGSTDRPTTTRSTSRCGRSPKSSASCCTPTRAPDPPTSGWARACCRSTRPRPAGGRPDRWPC